MTHRRLAGFPGTLPELPHYFPPSEPQNRRLQIQ